MKYKISLYCPDSHFLYDIRTLDQKGVGGGITARVRMAHALANLGHEVTLYLNCPQNRKIQGVHYINYSQCQVIDSDIFIASTSGGEFDLGGLQKLQINSKLKILLLHGILLPNNVNYQDFNYLYFPSIFVKNYFSNQIQLDQDHYFTCYHGVEDTFFKNSNPPRDPFNLVYLGHPEKGLEEALAVLRLLRRHNPLFKLHVFGGYGLWGNVQTSIPPEPGLVDHGLIGQKMLIPLLQKMSFSLNLQAIQEGFGLAVCESMKAGCVVLASRVGAYPEVIRQGNNGFLISGLHTDPQTHTKTANLILHLVNQPEYLDYVRKNAMQTPFSWQTIAKTWQGHMDWALAQKDNPAPQNISFAHCSQCNGPMLTLADGIHCVECGHYQQAMTEKHPS